jgi:hypothetical protein
MGTADKTTHQAVTGEIRRAFSAMGLTQSQGALRLYDVLHPESDDEDDAKRFAEAFKKQMTRDSTSLEVLERYLAALQELPEFRKAGMHYLRPIKNEHLPDELSKELKDISREIRSLVKSPSK